MSGSDPVQEDAWYLLYGGTSADGMGPGTYLTRTYNENIAKEHAAKCAADPYSVGYTLKVNDFKVERLAP